MELSFANRLKHAWNAFANKDPTPRYRDYGYATSYHPDRIRLTRGNERSIVTSVFNRIALDVALMNIVHAKVDDNDRYESTVYSGLNRCLTLEANMDQARRPFVQDIVSTKGVLRLFRLIRMTSFRKNRMKLDIIRAKHLRMIPLLMFYR